MSDARVPRVAANWISSILRPNYDSATDRQELSAELQCSHPGLQALAGHEFVLVIRALRRIKAKSFASIYNRSDAEFSSSLCDVHNSQYCRLEAVNAIRTMFYSDMPYCTKPNLTVMHELQINTDSVLKKYARQRTVARTTEAGPFLLPGGGPAPPFTAVAPPYSVSSDEREEHVDFGHPFYQFPAAATIVPSVGQSFIHAAPPAYSHSFPYPFHSDYSTSCPSFPYPFQNGVTTQQSMPNSFEHQKYFNTNTAIAPPLFQSQPIAPSLHMGVKRRKAGSDVIAGSSGSDTPNNNNVKNKKHKKSSPARVTPSNRASISNYSANQETSASSPSSFDGNQNNSTASSPELPRNISSSDSETQPQNPSEADALRQLMEMGFSDIREILSSIRHLTEIRRTASSSALIANNNHTLQSTSIPPVEDIMCYIIQQREEMAEARMMDAARLLSEETRKEESRRLREQAEKEMEISFLGSTIEEWVTNEMMFPQSWILQQLITERKACDTSNAENLLELLQESKLGLKTKLFELLQLEKKALKWYGKVLPKAYFENLSIERLLNPDQSDESYYIKQLDMEVAQLQKSMYELSEQAGSVPRVFRQAYDEELKTNHSDNEDNEIELIVNDDKDNADEDDETCAGDKNNDHHYDLE